MIDPTPTSNEVQTEPSATPTAVTTADTKASDASTETPPDRTRTRATGKITRRSALAGVGLLTASSLSGCLGFLGAEPVAADQPTTTPGTAAPASGSESGAAGIDDGADRGQGETAKKGDEQTAPPDAPTSLAGPGILPADVEPEEGRGINDQWQEPDYRAYLGPLTSANHGLQDVTITNTPHADRKNSPMLAFLDIDYLDAPVIESDGTFTITGAMHYTHECGYYGINYLDVTDAEAIIALAYTIDETTCTPEYAGRLGGRYGPITITGKLNPNLNVDHLTVAFLSGVHTYKLEESGGDSDGPWRSVASWQFHI